MNKKLRLSSTNKMFFGVCGGMGEFFGIDPTLIRIAWVIFFFAAVGIFYMTLAIYLVCFAIMPGDNSN